jgi:hypothetical protein
MPFDPKSLKKAGKKSKRGPVKKIGPSIKEKLLDDLLINQDKLSKTERVKLFVTLSGYLFPKNKLIEEKTKPENPLFKLADLVSFEPEEDSTK